MKVINDAIARIELGLSITNLEKLVNIERYERKYVVFFSNREGMNIPKPAGQSKTQTLPKITKYRK